MKCKKKQRKKLSKRKRELRIERAERKQAEARAHVAEAKAEDYKRRFRDFGKNVKILNSKNGPIKELEWTVQSVPYGTYAIMNGSEQDELIVHELLEQIITGLLETDAVQIIRHTKDETGPFGGCLFEQETVGVKMYVVPWDCMPHRRNIKISQYAD